MSERDELEVPERELLGVSVIDALGVPVRLLLDVPE